MTRSGERAPQERRARHRPRRRVPLLGLGVAAASLLGMSACGVPDQRSAVPIEGAGLPTPPSTVAGPGSGLGPPGAVYFVDSQGTLVPVARSDLGRNAAVALHDLLAGPTRAEVAAGDTSAIPTGTKMTSASVSGGTANLDFSSQLASVTGHEQLLAFAQIVATATSVQGVERVDISVEGHAVNAPEPNGTLAQGPVSKADYSSLLAG